MATILVYNNDTERMERYTRSENSWMPYNTNGTLKVKEFRGASKARTKYTQLNTKNIREDKQNLCF